jgi:hypothetical protein
VFDSVRIKARDEETALRLAHDLGSRFSTALVHPSESEWELRLESESDDDLPDLLGILYERLRAPEPTIDVLINGERYLPGSGS